MCSKYIPRNFDSDGRELYKQSKIVGVDFNSLFFIELSQALLHVSELANICVLLLPYRHCVFI